MRFSLPCHSLGKLSAPYCTLACLLTLCVVLTGCAPKSYQARHDQGASETALTAPPEALASEAMQAWQQGDCRESIRLFNNALQQQPHPALFNGLGLAFLQCNQAESAVQVFKQAASLAPSAAAIQSNWGTALFQAGSVQEAEQRFTQALRLDPAQPEALTGMAGVYLARQQPEKALQQLSKLSKADAAAPEVAYNKGLALYQMGLLDDAGEHLELYVQQHPHDAEAQNALGVIFLGQRRLAEAKQAFDRALALRPEAGRYYYNRGNLFKEQKAFTEAVADYSRALAFMPDMTEAYINRGDVRFLLREQEAACADLQQACDRGECQRLERYREAGRCQKNL